MCEKIWQNKFKISEGHFHVYLVVNNICRHELILYSPQVIVHSTWLNRKLNFCQLICLTTLICNAGLSPGSLLCSIFKTVFVISLQKEGLVYLYSIKTKCRFQAAMISEKQKVSTSINVPMWTMRACVRVTINWFTQAMAWDLQTM